MAKTSIKQLENGLVLYIPWIYSGNTYYDLSGNGYNWTGSNVTNSRSLQHNVMNFNGSNWRIVFTWPNPTTYWWNNFSFSCWVNINSFSWTNNKMIWRVAETSSWWNIQLYFNSTWTSLNWQPWNWQSNNIYTVNYTFSTWVWYHISFVRTATTEELFVNWTSIWKNTHSSFWFSNTWTQYSFSDTGNWNAYLNWKMSNIRLYNRALSSTEINLIRNAEYIK